MSLFGTAEPPSALSSRGTILFSGGQEENEAADPAGKREREAEDRNADSSEAGPHRLFRRRLE